MTRPDGEPRLRVVLWIDDDVGHVVGVVECSQEGIGVGQRGRLKGDDFGYRLGATRLLSLERDDCDVRVLESESVSRKENRVRKRISRTRTGGMHLAFEVLLALFRQTESDWAIVLTPGCKERRQHCYKNTRQQKESHFLDAGSLRGARLSFQQTEMCVPRRCRSGSVAVRCEGARWR